MRRRYFSNRIINNKIIIYTSSDNLIVIPSYYDFGARVITNTVSNNIGTITFDGDVTKIGVRAFAWCENLSSITIPNSVTTIGDYAFEGCPNLTSITIPDSVTTIAESAFQDCDSLTSVTIPDSVTEIGQGAFNHCNNLTSATIPNSVITIGANAFNICYSLTSVYCKATTPPSLEGTSVFDDNGSGRKIYVPAESVSAYKRAEYWSEYADAIEGYNF